MLINSSLEMKPQFFEVKNTQDHQMPRGTVDYKSLTPGITNVSKCPTITMGWGWALI